MRRLVPVVLLSLLAACSGGDEAKVDGPTRTVAPTTGTAPHVALGVEIVLEDDEVAAGEVVRGVLRSRGSDPAETGADYALSRKVGDRYEPHPLDVLWTTQLFVLEPGGELPLTVSTDGLPPGDWRVTKTFTSGRDQGSVQAAGYFTITAS